MCGNKSNSCVVLYLSSALLLQVIFGWTTFGFACAKERCSETWYCSVPCVSEADDQQEEKKGYSFCIFCAQSWLDLNQTIS